MMHKGFYFLIILVFINLCTGLEEIHGSDNLKKMILLNDTHVQFWSNITIAIENIPGCNDPANYEKCIHKAICGVEFKFDNALYPIDPKSESIRSPCSLSLEFKGETFKIACKFESFGESGACIDNDVTTTMASGGVSTIKTTHVMVKKPDAAPLNCNCTIKCGDCNCPSCDSGSWSSGIGFLVFGVLLTLAIEGVGYWLFKQQLINFSLPYHYSGLQTGTNQTNNEETRTTTVDQGCSNRCFGHQSQPQTPVNQQ